MSGGLGPKIHSLILGLELIYVLSKDISVHLEALMLVFGWMAEDTGSLRS